MDMLSFVIGLIMFLVVIFGALTAIGAILVFIKLVVEFIKDW